MKPERLVMQAFGPFTGREEIDFTLFGASPMILINGPTGSGKSTVLDAICFALYGSTSGVDRDASQMRAQQAAGTVLSEVEFTFSLGTDRWRIRRVPHQRRPKLKGDGETEQKPEAQVWRMQGDEWVVEVPRGMGKTTRFIETLTGLNADQFRQVMVLPQGRFRELLVAPSAEREKIYSTLFDASVYRRIEESLKEQANGLRSQVKAKANKAGGILEAAGVQSESALVQALEELESASVPLGRQKQQAQNALDNCRAAVQSGEALMLSFCQFDAAGETLARVQAESKALADDRKRLSLARAAQSIDHDFRTLESARTAQSELENTIAALQQQIAASEVQLDSERTRFSKVENARASLQSRQQQLHQLEAFVQQHEQVQQRKKARITARERFDTAHGKQLAVQASLDVCLQQFNQLESQLRTDQQTIVDGDGDQVALQRLQQAIAQRDALDELARQQKTLDNTLDSLQKSIKVGVSRVKQETHLLQRLEYQWHAGQAALLARQLARDQPCPVCGSRQHPALADSGATGDLVEHSRVEDMRLELDSVKNELRLLELQNQELHSERKRIVRDIEALEIQHPDSGDQAMADLQKQLQSLQRRIDKRAALKTSLTQLASRIAGAKATMVELQSSVANAMNTRAMTQAELSNSEQEYNSALAAIPEAYKDVNVLKREIVAVKTLQKQVDADFQLAQNDLRAAELSAKGQGASLSTLQSQRQSVTAQTGNCEQRWEMQLAKSVFVDQRAFLRSRLQGVELDLLVRKIERHDQAMSEARGSLNALKIAIVDKTRPDLTMLSEALQQAKNTHAASATNSQSAQDRLGSLKNAQTLLEQSLTQTRALHERYSVIGRLSTTASGQAASRISLHRFVLSVLLDDVLLVASQRLRKMSGQRYELLRRGDAATGVRAAGLELDVFDAFSDSSRPVSTLSGGESFQAALALALGLSDVVQAYAGGIRLDTLFIDEGFGSLDTDALELAIDTLVELQSSGRTIAVISHVTEMKEQITQRLDIVPSATGSRALIRAT